MSQIFESLRRTREQPRHGDGVKRTARADAVLATMGFASQRPRSPRERFAPLLLAVLLCVGAWLAWRWYMAGAETYPIARLQPSTSSQPAGSVPQAQSSPSPRASSPSAPPPATARVEQPVPVPRVAPLAATPPPSVAPQLPGPATGTPRNLVNPRNPETLENLGNPQTRGNPDPFQLALYYQRTGDFENALMHYRAVLQRNQLNVQAHNNLGLLYRDKGLLDDAVREFQRALLIDGRYMTARNNLGVALLGQGRSEEAAAEFRQVLAQEPRNVDAMVNLALAERSAGRPGVAMETLIRATGVDPRSAPAHYNLAILYEQSGESGRAVDHYRAFLDHAGTQHATRAPEVRARLAELAKRAARN